MSCNVLCVKVEDELKKCSLQENYPLLEYEYVSCKSWKNAKLLFKKETTVKGRTAGGINCLNVANKNIQRDKDCETGSSNLLKQKLKGTIIPLFSRCLSHKLTWGWSNTRRRSNVSWTNVHCCSWRGKQRSRSQVSENISPFSSTSFRKYKASLYCHKNKECMSPTAIQAKVVIKILHGWLSATKIQLNICQTPSSIAFI